MIFENKIKKMCFTLFKNINKFKIIKKILRSKYFFKNQKNKTHVKQRVIT